MITKSMRLVEFKAGIGRSILRQQPLASQSLKLFQVRRPLVSK
jgi:hypothetical protein